MKAPTHKQAKSAALKIHARIIVHDRGKDGCEAKLHGVVATPCSNDGALQCAHIISRRYDATSTSFGNAWALCPGHHRQVDTNPMLWVNLVFATRGIEHVRWSWGVRSTEPTVGGKKVTRLVWWRAELNRLTWAADLDEIDLSGVAKGPVEWARAQ